MYARPGRPKMGPYRHRMDPARPMRAPTDPGCDLGTSRHVSMTDACHTARDTDGRLVEHLINMHTTYPTPASLETNTTAPQSFHSCIYSSLRRKWSHDRAY